MRLLMLIACAALAAPAAAQPPSDPMAGYYVATLRIEVPGQDYLARRFFEPDHTYRDRMADGAAAGRWWIEGGRICTQQAGAPKYCNLGLGKQPGESWTDHDPYTGNEVDFALVPGRADESGAVVGQPRRP